MRGLTQVAAQDLASEGITVNAFAPDMVQTPMMESIAVATAEEAGKPEAWGSGTIYKSDCFGQSFTTRRCFKCSELLSW